MGITRLGAWGHGTQPTGSFAGKNSAPVPPPPPPPDVATAIPGGALGYRIPPRRRVREIAVGGELELLLRAEMAGVGSVTARPASTIVAAARPFAGRGDLELTLAFGVEVGVGTSFHKHEVAGHFELALAVDAEAHVEVFAARVRIGPGAGSVDLPIEALGVIFTMLDDEEDE